MIQQILTEISCLVIGFSIGTIVAEIYRVRPLIKSHFDLRKVVLDNLEFQLKLIHKLYGVPEKEADGSMKSPIQIKNDNQ